MDKIKFNRLLIQITTTIKEAMQRLNETGERILFVVCEGGKLLGTLTDGDIRKAIIKGLPFSHQIGAVMNRDYLSIKAGKSNIEQQAKEIMIQHMIERIPILDEQSHIVDVIRWIDILGESRRSRSLEQYPNQVVIMAGGKGTRLDPFTKVLPKPLIPIGEKPVIEHIMEKYSCCGFYNFIYTLNYKKEFLKLYLKETTYSYNIDWVEEEEFLGTAGGLSLLKNKITDTFFVTNCDSLLDVNYSEILKWHQSQNALMTIIGCHSEINIPFGVLHLSNGKLEKIREKPVHDVIINTGVYVMEPAVLSQIPEGQRLDMNELIQLLIDKEKISVFPIYGNWLDIGQWDEYKKSIKQLKDLTPHEE